MPYKFNPFTAKFDKVNKKTFVQFVQDATNTDFKHWTLSDTVINGSDQLILADA